MPSKVFRTLFRRSTKRKMSLNGNAIEVIEFRKRLNSNSSMKSSHSRKTSTLNQCTELDLHLNEMSFMIKDVLNHRMDQVVERCHKMSDNMHFALYGALFEHLDDIITLKREALISTLNNLKRASAMAAHGRSKSATSWSSWFHKIDYDAFTDEEMHAELCYADSQILIGLISVFVDHTFTGSINAALCARAAHNSYQ